MARKLALIAFVAIVFSHALDSDIGWELMVTSAGPEVPRTCQSVEGLPSWLSGSFYLAGPALFEMGGISFKSHFDGYGRTNRFEMHNGQVCYTSAWLNTSYYQDAKKLGRVGPGVLFEGTIPDRPSCPMLDPVCDLHAPLDNNWVNMIPVGDEALLLTDAPLMLKFDLKTLNVTGAYPWEDKLETKYHRSTTGSAHPVLRPGTEATYVSIASMMPIMPFVSPAIAVYSIDAKQGKKRSIIASVPTKHVQYLHSFGVTKNYVVLPCNLKMGINSNFLEHRPYMLSAFEDAWDGIHVVDLEGNMRVFETEPFFHIHIANTFENATGIVMDIGTTAKIPFADGPMLTTAKFLNKTMRDAGVGPFNPQFRRYHLHTAGPNNGSVSIEVLSTQGRMHDFFKINPAYNGLPYCVTYMTEWLHDDKSYASMAILKHDLCKGTRTYWHKEFNYLAEPFFIPAPNGGEEDGVVVFVALDGVKRISQYVVLDAATFKEIAIVPLPAHIPFTAHGSFYPSVGESVATAVSRARAAGLDSADAVVGAVESYLSI
eukprot:TRINITY_DN33244_c0_g1_i1.p1 TRINITY_DN33244_c0_g1~~TRINITY_DN33244_c0_g1_i1.p1  ORF type:complete len:542 (-),score=61.17 TRINITY_DN33244_c0_g1_i1:249-1874(-)